MKYFYSLLLQLLFTLTLLAQVPCPPEGTASNEKEKELNRQKNRSVAFISNPKSVSIDELLKEGNDTARFSHTDYVTVTGFVTETKPGGPESCNCGSENKKDHDIHIYIGRKKNAKKKNCFIAEVTPPFKNNNAIDYKKLKGKKVRITGYLLFDFEHKGNAKNSCKKCTRIWRKTAWEIHPIVKIELI